MNKKKLQFNQPTLAILYKLFHDSLLMFIIFFTLTLVAEAVLPGIILSHIGFSKMVVVILTNIILLEMLAKKITPDQIDQSVEPKNKSVKKIIIPLLVLGALLIFNSQMKMNVFLNLFIISISAIIGYLSYKNLSD